MLKEMSCLGGLQSNECPLSSTDFVLFLFIKMLWPKSEEKNNSIKELVIIAGAHYMPMY